MNRITWKIQEVSRRYRAQMYVDLHEMQHAWFDSYDKAEQWCYRMREELAREVREYS